MLRLHTLFVFLFFVFISAYGAQTYSVKGVVTSHATGEGLPFVSVGIWNTPMGTMTDLKGEYQLSIPAGDSIVVIYSCLGYRRSAASCSISRKMFPCRCV